VLLAVALVSFEVLLSQLLSAAQASTESLQPLAEWAYLALGYSLFIWASISAISLKALRPDMLMSAFIYFAAAWLVYMKGRPARWNSYLLLGVLLGLGYLAKAPLLPLGILILILAVLIVKSCQAAVKMALTSLALLLLIGSAYFVPLSLSRGRLTLGESGTFNYLLYVDGIGPGWYMQDVGVARGAFLHVPQRLSSRPPAYAFPRASRVTHPLRFDPSEWVAGVYPRFSFAGQFRALRSNATQIAHLLRQLAGVLACLLVVSCFSWGRASLFSVLVSNWPIWLLGMSGCLMYTLVHVEPRYVGEFFVLVFIGFVCRLRIPLTLNKRYVVLSVIAIAGSILGPILWTTSIAYVRSRGLSNTDGQAAVELADLGVRSEDRVARIGRQPTDLALERIVRAEIVAEVDFRYAQAFWTMPPEGQQRLLQMLVAHGAKAVIATSPPPDRASSLGWKRLGVTRFWAWLPPRDHL
jgi:hypothetical protein